MHHFLISSDDVMDYMNDKFGEGDAEDLVVQLECGIGFTFSFACEQTQLNKAYVRAMGKGFNIEGIANQDVVELMQNAIAENDGLTKPGTVGSRMTATFGNHSEN